MVPSIIPFAVTNERDAEILRETRNACRENMTRRRTEISREEQSIWWAENCTLMQMFLYYEQIGFDPIGYGVVRREAGALPEIYVRPLLTGAVLWAFRGRGYGEAVFRHLIKAAGVPCCLEVRADNEVARKLYKKLGFETTAEANGIETMWLTPENAEKCGVV